MRRLLRRLALWALGRDPDEGYVSPEAVGREVLRQGRRGDVWY